MASISDYTSRFDALRHIWDIQLTLMTPDMRQSYYKGRCKLCEHCAQAKNCRDMQYAGKITAQMGISSMHRCALGGVLFAGTIMRDDSVEAFVLLGPVRMWEWDDYAREELLDIIQARPALALDTPDALADYCSELLYIGSSSARDLCQLMFDTCAAISCEGNYLALQRDSYYVQSKLFDVFENEKRATAEIDYPIDTEQELLRRVRVGDNSGAKAILNELLGKILFANGNNIDVLKARSLELVVMISRAAVEGGAELNRLLGMNYSFIGELSALNTFDEVCLWLTRVLDKFMDTVYGTRATPNMLLLRNAASFISLHYADNISLEDVASEVHVSPYYLSHLFREELSITFIEYLTRTRVDKAKQLLADQQLSVSEVAHSVGYDDSGYFSRVFKKMTGRTPASYRR